MIHRDDVPYEKIEEMERCARMMTGDENAKILFLGDIPPKDLPQDVMDRLKEIEKINQESINRGFCVDCFQAMPIYEPWLESWKADEGWVCLMDHSEEPAGWLCEMCINEMTLDEEDLEDERWTITDKDPEELEGDFE